MQKTACDEVQDEEVFCHFDGGKTGIKQRFGQKIQDALRKISGLDAGQLAGHVGLRQGEIPKICDGDFSVVNRQLIEALTDPLEINVEECLGPIKDFDNNEEAVRRWEQRAEQEGFFSVGGATSVVWSKPDQAKLFLFLQAMEKL
jgi:hypothetical protein